TLLAKGKSSGAIYELRGLARTHLGDYAGAIDDDTKALAFLPNSVALLCGRGGLYLITDAPRLALRDFQEAIRLDSSCRDAFMGRGSARVILRQHRQAVADVEKALSIGEPTPRMLFNAARVFCRAAGVVAPEVRAKGRDAVAQVNRYQD